MNKNLIYILIVNLLIALPDCEHGSPNWEELYESVPFDYEFNATISAAQIFIDGIEMTTGKLAGFVNDDIRALDSDGSMYFPPGDTNVFDLMLWSNEVSGESFSFKYYSEDNDIVIDLIETYDFESNDIVGDAFNPMILNGSALDCEFEDENHFSNIVDTTGVSQLIILSNSITTLDQGDQIGIFDYNGLISEGEECLDITGEVLVGTGEWDGNQLEIVAWSHIDFCDFPEGTQFPGFIEDNPINIKIWDISEQSEYDAYFIVSEGSYNFQETSFVVISEICNINNLPDNACDCNGNIEDDCGVCGGNGIDYDQDGICDDIDECVGEYDDCGICNGNGPQHQCWNGAIVCDPFECPESEFPSPDLFSFNQSLSQAFYFINNIYIDNLVLSSDDWLAAFNGDICIGSRKWDTDMCTNNICDIGVMGYDGSDSTEGYILNGQFPSFKIYDSSENIYYDAVSSENFAFENSGLFIIENIQNEDYYCNDNPSCSGCTDINACNYDANALIESTCYYLESELFQPPNNQIIEIDELEQSINFMWSDIDQSCDANAIYIIKIFDSNNQLIFSTSTQENNIEIIPSELIINQGQINSCSWNISIDDTILSDTFYFTLDDTNSLNINEHKINEFKLYQNYPNPFNPATYIQFDNPGYNFIKINIYNTNGLIIKELVNDYYNPGTHKVYWDGSNFPSGIYLYELKFDNKSIRKKMVLVK